MRSSSGSDGWERTRSATCYALRGSARARPAPRSRAALCPAKVDAFSDRYLAKIVLEEMVSTDAKKIENIVQALTRILLLARLI